MYFFIFIFILLFIVSIKFNLKSFKRKKRKKKVVFYALTSQDRESVKKIKEQIVCRLDNLPQFTSIKNYKTLKMLGLPQKPIYKVDICSTKQFYLYNAAKRLIKKEFNLVCLFKKRLPLKSNKGVYCFIKKNLSVEEFSLLNSFDISHSTICRSKYGKLFNVEKVEIDKYYTDNFLVTEFNGGISRFTRNLNSIYFCLESKKCERVVVGFNDIMQESVALIKKVKGGFLIYSLYENKQRYVLSNAKSTTKNGVGDCIVFYGKNIQVCICNKLQSPSECLKEIKQSFSVNLKLKSEFSKLDRYFNYFLPSAIIRNLIMKNNEQDFENYISCDKVRDFELSDIKNVCFSDNVSEYYNYIKRVLIGFNENSGRIKIQPASSLLNKYEIEYNNFKIEVVNNQSEVKKVSTENVCIVNSNVLPLGKCNRVKVYC